MFVCIIDWDGLLYRLCSCCIVSAVSPSIESIAVEKIDHDDVMDLLRDAFPDTLFRGVEGGEFYVLPLTEIEKLLSEDNTDDLWLEETGDYVARLIGNFSRPGLEKIPIGFMKTDKVFCNVVIAFWLGEPVVFKINPKTDQIEKVFKDSTVKFVVMF